MAARTTTRPICAPPRGTRPRNRRDLLLAAAADLFRERGYGNLSMKDVAAASNMSPSSLYSHFSGKPELLHDTIEAQLDRCLAHLTDGPAANLDAVAARLVDGALDTRPLGVLWQRESRNLDTAMRADLRRKMTRISSVVRDAVLAERADLTAGQAGLLTQCALGAVTSISFHSQSLPRNDFGKLLNELCLRMLCLRPSAPTDPRRRSTSRARAQDRQQELADTAVALFAERGFFAVSVDDIGAAVGIAGPSVYKHVQSKQDLLQAAFERGHAVLRNSIDNVDHDSPSAALRGVSDAYVTLALDQADLITVLIAEVDHLDADARHSARRDQRAYIDDWVTLAHNLRPEDPVTTRIKVQAAQMVANDIARTPHLHRVPGWRATVHHACWTLQQ